MVLRGRSGISLNYGLGPEHWQDSGDHCVFHLCCQISQWTEISVYFTGCCLYFEILKNFLYSPALPLTFYVSEDRSILFQLSGFCSFAFGKSPVHLRGISFRYPALSPSFGRLLSLLYLPYESWGNLY